MDGDEFLVRLRAGDDAAWAELVGRFTPKVLGLATRMVGSADAKDVCQETFIRISSGIARFRGASRLSTWIFRIAWNVCAKRCNYTKREREALTQVNHFQPGSDETSREELLKAVE